MKKEHVMNMNEVNSVSDIVGQLLSPTEQFNQLMQKGERLEEAAWNTIRTWHEPVPLEYDAPLVCPKAVEEITAEICNLYGMASATASILAYLYVKHRALYLTYHTSLYVYPNGYYVSPSQPGEWDRNVMGFSYSGCSGPMGDIVEFDKLVLSEIAFPPGFPSAEAWKQLQTDHGLPLGLLNYRRVAEVLKLGLRTNINDTRSQCLIYLAWDHFVEVTRLVERERWQLQYPIAMVVHSVVMQALCKA
jgi:hypothetical protein